MLFINDKIVAQLSTVMVILHEAYIIKKTVVDYEKVYEKIVSCRCFAKMNASWTVHYGSHFELRLVPAPLFNF